MDVLIFMVVVIAALLFGIYLGNDGWVKKANSGRLVQCRGRLYIVQEQDDDI